MHLFKHIRGEGVVWPQTVQHVTLVGSFKVGTGVELWMTYNLKQRKKERQTKAHTNDFKMERGHP